MIKWGTTFGSHDGALAVFVDDELVFASDAERWSRKKNDPIIPGRLIEFAENKWGVPEIVYFYEDLNLKDERRKFAGQKPLDELIFKYPITYCNHHESHARYGYYTSPFISCTVLVIDAIGEWNTMTQWKVKDGAFALIEKWDYPKSLGLFYSAMTQAAGWKPNEEEYILMGASAVTQNYNIHDYQYIKSMWDNNKSFHQGIDVEGLTDEFEIAAIAQDIYEEEFQKKIDEFKPDVIALSSMTMSFDFAISLLNKVDCKGAKVIAGGVHATIAPEDALGQSVVDIITIGEADETFPELLTLMQNGEDYTNVKSMHFKMPDGSIKKNPLAARPGLDDLPCPDWDLFDIKHLFRPFDGKIYKGSFYSQSRGCPMSCTYCVDPTIADVTGGNKGYFRFQPPETTYNHLSELKSKYGARWLKFSDDTFLLPKADHLEHLRDLIKPLGILFGCSVMPNTIRENKVDLAKEMGCVAMSVGIESGDPDVRKKLMRHYNNEKLVNNLQMVINKEIRVSTFNIIGFPEENRDQVFKTIELNREIGTSACNVYILYPYPGTPIAIKNKIPLRDQNGKIPTQDIACELGLSKMSSDELRGLLKTFNLYLHLNKPLWPIIQLAEKQTEIGRKINTILSIRHSSRVFNSFDYLKQYFVDSPAVYN